MKIAIIGTGISGLAVAYALQGHHDITVYEKNTYIGGHSRTIEIETVQGQRLPVDTGFIVFNKRNYPLLTGLFDHLGVATEKSDMSFGASIGNGWLEYSSSAMFGQIRNIVRPRYWRMLVDILRFNRTARKSLERDVTIPLGAYLDDLKTGAWFRKYYLQAMGAAIWSCSVDTIRQFPAATFLRFFDNHGLLTVMNQPQWYTVTGGSREYIGRMTAGFRDRIHLDRPVKKLERRADGVIVHDGTGQRNRYDQVIFACHADQALAVIDKAASREKEVLGAFTYQENRIVVHQDQSFMPENRSCWASWVYLSEDLNDSRATVSLSYWMNNLQNLETDRPVIITLNPGRRPQEDLILDEHEFKHPVFNAGAVAAQKHIKDIQGTDRLWYCGAYQGYGFHEDGLRSAVNVAKALGEGVPWN